MPLFLKLQLSRLMRPLAHVCTRRVSPSPRLCTKSHAVRPCSPFSTCAPSTLSLLYLCAAAVPGNHPHGHCTWPLLPSIEGYPQGARRAAQLVTCSARVPRTRSRMLLCGPLDLAASQGAYALQPRVLRVRSAAAIPRTHGQPLRPLWRRFSISSPLGTLSLRWAVAAALVHSYTVGVGESGHELGNGILQSGLPEQRAMRCPGAPESRESRRPAPPAALE
jgi:hypothetical protein